MGEEAEARKGRAPYSNYCCFSQANLYNLTSALNLERESGDSWIVHVIGSADRGLYRVHQFSKVEMFVISTPEQSDAILEELCQLEEEIFQELGLHYKVLVSFKDHI